METSTKRIIEINGIKMEVDFREAKTVNSYKVGDSVKILIKDYSSYKDYIGTIIGFDEFVNLPTIVVAYLTSDYSETSIKFAYINSQTKDIEICSIANYDIPYSKSSIMQKMNSELQIAEQKVKDLKGKIKNFDTLFGKYFDKANGGE